MLSSSGGSSVIIDATNTSIPQDQAYLGYLIAKAHERGENYLPELTNIPFPPLSEEETIDLLKYGPIPKQLMLLQKLIGRPRSSDPLEYRYDVYSARIDGGAFGGIEQVIGTLAPLPNNRVEFKPKDYVAKIQDEPEIGPNGQDAPLPQQEASYTKRMPALKSKPITFFSQPAAGGKVINKSSIVMHRIHGQNLEKFFLKDDEEKIKKENSTPTDKRLEYCIAGAKALKLVHLLNVVHRDMKPANTMLAESSFNQKAVILDFGLSRDVHVPDEYNVGTPLYAGPEYWEKKIPGIEGDIFALAWQLARILRGDDNPSMTIHRAYLYSKNCHFDNLFTGITDLSPKHQEQIKEILAKMVKESPADRCSLNAVITVFEEILLERKMEKMVNKNEAVQLEKAFKAGVALRSELEPFAKIDSGTFIKNIPRFKEIFIRHLNKLPNFPIVFPDFINSLDIRSLKLLQTKEETIETVEQIFAKFLSLNEKLEQMRASARLLLDELKLKPSPEVDDTNTKKALEKIIHKVSLQLERHAGSLTLDAIVRVNHKAEKVLDEYADNLRTYLKAAKQRGLNIKPLFKPYSMFSFQHQQFTGKVKIFEDYRPFPKAKQAEEMVQPKVLVKPMVIDDYEPQKLDPNGMDVSTLLHEITKEIDERARPGLGQSAGSLNPVKKI